MDLRYVQVTLEPLSDAVIAWARGLTTMEGLAHPLPPQASLHRSGVLGLLCAFTCVQNFALRLHDARKESDTMTRRRVASPHQMALLECCNYVGGDCIEHDEGLCLLKKSGARCGYFEKAVLPLCKREPPYLDGKYADVWDVYYKAAAKRLGASVHALDIGVSDVRRCGCGQPIGARRRMCDKCRNRARRETLREAQSLQRAKIGV